MARKINSIANKPLSQGKGKGFIRSDVLSLSGIVDPFGTAVWLIDNTSLSFQQIADFTSLSMLEISSIADGFLAKSVLGSDPVRNGYIKQSDITICEQNHAIPMPKPSSILANITINYKKNSKTYTPLAAKKNKPSAILWFAQSMPQVPAQIVAKMLGTRKETISSVIEKNKTADIGSEFDITPKDPVTLGLCTKQELDNLLVSYPPKSV
jgi:hypothetical protein